MAEHFFYFQDLFARNAIDTICRDYHIESKRAWTVCKLARTMSATPLVFHVLSLEHWKHQRASCPERSLPAGLELQIRAWSRLTHAVLRLGRMNDITLLLSTCTSALPSEKLREKRLLHVRRSAPFPTDHEICAMTASLDCLQLATECSENSRSAQIFMDATSVAKRPCELAFVYSPADQRGAFAPPLVQSLITCKKYAGRATF